MRRQRVAAINSDDGSSVRQPRVRRAGGPLRKGYVAAVTSVLLLAIFSFASFQILSARQELLAAANDLSAASGLVNRVNALQQPRVRREMIIDLSRARSEFSAARDHLWPWDPILAHIGWLPGVGSQAAAAFPVANAGAHEAAGVMCILTGLRGVWPALSRHRVGRPLLPLVVPELATAQSDFRSAAQDISIASRELADIPRDIGSATLDRRLARLRRYLPNLHAASLWLAASPMLLGWRQPSHFLLIFEDSRELRATGGFIGAADYLTIRDGAISTQASGSALPSEHPIALPTPEAMYTDEGYWLFRDSNWSPDFPLTARYERWLYGIDTGRWADSVLDILYGASTIIQATGPVYLSSYRQLVTPANAQAIAVHNIYGVEHYAPTSAARDAERTRFLGVLVRALTLRIQSLSLGNLISLADDLHSAINRQQLLMYSTRRIAQSAIMGAGAAGAIVPPRTDYLFVVDDNRSYSKLNPFIREQATYSVKIQPDLWSDASLTLRYRVDASPANLDGVGPMFGRLGTKHDYQDFIRVYVPLGSRLVSETGAQPWAPEPAYGLTQFAGRILVREGQTRLVTFRYRVPPSIFAGSGPHEYVVTVQREPSGNLNAVRLVVSGWPGVQVKSGAAASSSILDRTVNLGGQLTVVRASVSGSIRPASYSPPSPVGGDPYVAPRAFREKGHTF